jgi:hypothetical protein
VKGTKPHQACSKLHQACTKDGVDVQPCRSHVQQGFLAIRGETLWLFGMVAVAAPLGGSAWRQEGGNEDAAKGETASYSWELH